MLIWNEQFETMPRPQLETLQLERHKEVVTRISQSVPFYKRRFAEAGISPDDLKSLENIGKLPFTINQDLRDNYPFGIFAVPLNPTGGVWVPLYHYRHL